VTPPPQDPDASRRIPDAGFAGDDGAAPPALTAALAAYAADPGRHADALAALQDARLLVPVVGLRGEVGHDAAGRAPDKSSDKGPGGLRGADGRLALLAFTGLESLRAWDPDARPVPVATRLAAQSALQDDAAALVIDVAGPTTFVIEGEDLRGLAAGWTLARVGERPAWIGPSPE
jgi:hypothetical protein